MKFREYIYNMRGMSLKDIWLNIKMAKIGLIIGIKDPFMKHTIEDALKIRHIKYVSGYNSDDKLYDYAIVGGKMDDIMDFVGWFKNKENWTDKWSYAFIKNGIFKTDITYLIR